MFKQAQIIRPLWRLVGLLIFLQSLFANWQLLRIPESETGVIAGLSLARLAEVIFATLAGMGGLGLLLQIKLKPPYPLEQWAAAHREIIRDFLLGAAILSSILAGLVWVILRALSQGGVIYRYVAYLERLWPVLFLIIFAGIEIGLMLIFKSKPDSDHPARTFLFRSRWIGLVLALVLALIGITNTGITPVLDGYWGFPAVPLLEWHWLAACILTILVAILTAKGRLHAFAQKRWLIALIIWGIAASAWLATPLQYSNYAPAPRAPTYEVYPFNDGMNYDLFAQSILTGNGMANGDIPPRPLYIVFLALLHVVAGQDYHAIITAQTLVLALFPAVLYLIGAELLGTPFGIGAAFLVIIRDIFTNSVAPFAIDVTYTKYYFSEVPTALLLSAAVYFSIQWLKKPVATSKLLAIGGLIGMAGLIRTQSLIILPVILLLALPVFWKNRSRWLKQSAVIAACAVLVVMPWLIRNYSLTGGFIFDHPATQTMVFAQRYLGNEAVQPLTDSSENMSEYSSELMQTTLTAFFQEPGKYLPKILGNFVHNELGSLQLLPLRSELDDMHELVSPTQAFWEGALERFKLPWVAISASLIVFGLGLSAIWQRTRWAGLIPLAANLAYNFWTALFLSSGERFLIPVDWAFLIYLLAGLIVLISGIGLLFTTIRLKIVAVIRAALEPASQPAQAARPSARATILIASLFLLAGVSIPLSERVFPQIYPQQSQSELLRTLSQQNAVVDLGLSEADIDAMAAQPGYHMYYGRALFPRFYPSGDGEPSNAKIGYTTQPISRLLFYVVGPENKLVYVQMPAAPEFFPNTADVIFIAKEDQRVLYAQLVWVSKDGQSLAFLGD